MVQQGPPLSSGATDLEMGYSVALSADGNTALVGGPYAEGYAGAVFAFARSGSTWSAEGTLTPSDGVGPSQFGQSVSLTADGDTALIGGPTDETGVPEPSAGGGAEAGNAWVFTRSGATWSQDGSRLLSASEMARGSWFGDAVALSQDGSAALVAEPALCYVTSFAHQADGSWVLQGLVPTVSEYCSDITPTDPSFGLGVALSANGDTSIVSGLSSTPTPMGTAGVAVQPNVTTRVAGLLADPATLGTPLAPPAGFPAGVALSGDGNTALVEEGAGPQVYVRSVPGAPWMAQGAPLSPTGGPVAGFGSSLALSFDGSTALVGASPGLDANGGTAWLFTRTGGAWTPSGNLTPSDHNVGFGTSVALSADGTTALVGAGASEAYVFVDAASGPSRSARPVVAIDSQRLTGGRSRPTLVLTCASAPCSGSLVLIGPAPSPTLPHRHGANSVLARATFRLRSGERTEVSLTLTAAGRRAVAAGGEATAEITVSGDRPATRAVAL